jgi:hypothetical protein
MDQSREGIAAESFNGRLHRRLPYDMMMTWMHFAATGRVN